MNTWSRAPLLGDIYLSVSSSPHDYGKDLRGVNLALPTSVILCASNAETIAQIVFESMKQPFRIGAWPNRALVQSRSSTYRQQKGPSIGASRK